MGAMKKTNLAQGLLVAVILALLFPLSGIAGPAPGGGGFIIKSGERRQNEPWKSQAFDGLFIGMTAADLKNDGSRELFLLSKRKLIVARKGPGKLEIIKEIKAIDGTDNVSITSLGHAVYISAIFDNKPYGSIIEFKDNDYRVTVTGITWLMRTVGAPGSAPALVGERFRRPDGFYGGLRLLAREGSSVVDRGPFMELPRNVDIYRFDILESNARQEIVTLTGRDYLRRYVKSGDGDWQKTWSSDDNYGGTLNYIYFLTGHPDVEEEPVAIEGKFSQAVKDSDGKTELIVKKNIPSGLGRFLKMPSFDRGEVAGLVWDGENLAEKWKTKDISGYISDFTVEDEAGERTITLLVVEGLKSLTGGTPKSYVLSYRFSIQ